MAEEKPTFDWIDFGATRSRKRLRRAKRVLLPHPPPKAVISESL